MSSKIANELGISVQVKVGALELLHSGLVHLDGEDWVEIKILDLSLRFKFISDGGEARYDSDVVDKTLNITLANFRNSLGEGKLKPIHIGHIAERKLYLTFFSNTLSLEDNVRQFEYALYLGESV